MTISLISAWLTVLFAAAAALRYFARISKSPWANRFFHNIHKVSGVLMIVTGLLHGLLAGNAGNAKLSEAEIGAVLFTLNWGTVCFVLSLLLAGTYLLRKKLRKRWMPLHRVLTAALVIVLALHLINVGIRLPKHIISGTDNAYGGSSDASVESGGASALFSGAKLRDGVYEGSGDGFKGIIKVSVTVEGGVVTAIEILEASDTPNYFERAAALTDKIIGTQSLKVDAVAGASISSAGIISAVANALSDAVIDGALQTP